MDTRTIKMNNEALRIGTEHLLTQLRSEGLRYHLWVTGTDRGSTVHLRVAELTSEMKDRVCNVLRGRGVLLDINHMEGTLAYQCGPHVPP